MSHLKELLKTSVDKFKVSQDYIVKNYKYYLRKWAIKRIREKINDLGHKETDYTKEKMLEMIKKEEKRIIKDMGVQASLGSLLAMFGVSSFFK